MDAKVGEIDDFDAVLLAKAIFEFVPALYFLQRFFSSPDFVWYKMLRSLAFYSDAIIWNEEVQVHMPDINQPIKCLLLYELDSTVAQKGAHLLFEVG